MVTFNARDGSNRGKDMNLQQLVTFSTVVSEGSMTAAAEKLFLTQPAVSQQIRNLEEELGIGLLDRGARHARPTVQGQLLYDYAKRIIQLTQQAQAAVQTMAEGAEGHLRIGTLNSLGLQMVAPSVAGLLKHHNRVTAELVYDDAPHIMDGLKRGKLDIAILPSVPGTADNKTTGFIVRPVTKDEMWLVASGRDPSLPEEIKVSELSQRPFVRLSEKYERFDKILQNLLQASGRNLPNAFECNNVGTLKRVIEMGIGWGFLPAHAIKKQVRMGRLTQVKVSDLQFTTDIEFYSRGDSQPIQKLVDVFYRTLRQNMTSR